MNKQSTGFKYGKNPTKLIRNIGQVTHNGRIYRLSFVEADGSLYVALRLYNEKGKFIKQFMTEPTLSRKISQLYTIAARSR